MALFSELKPSQLQLMDATLSNAARILYDSDVWDLNADFGPQALVGRPGADTQIKAHAGQDVLFQDSSGATVMEYPEASGIISTPKQSCFRAYVNTDQSITWLVSTKIQFDSVNWDIQNEYDETTNYRFTATVAGKYYVGITILIGTIGNGEGVHLIIKKNGTTNLARIFRLVGIDTPDLNLQVSDVVDLVAGDYIEGYVMHTDAVNAVKIKSTSERSYFRMIKVA